MVAGKDGAVSPLAAKPIVWTIAGSDSGGGAGIQADLLTLNDLGCHGCSVITAITAQNSVAVTLVEAVSDAMLTAQLEALKADLYPSAVKIGLIANQQQLEFLALWIADNLPSVPVILDPVMVASCGDVLQVQTPAHLNEMPLDATADKPKPGPQPKQRKKSVLNFTPFAGMVTLMTPNTTEIGELAVALDAQTSAETTNASFEPESFGPDSLWLAQARLVRKHFGVSVLAKGGDASWQRAHARDLLLLGDISNISALYRGGEFYLDTPRVNTTNNHGSGCTLSSAIAALMAKGMVLPDAVILAKAYVYEGIKAAYQPGQGSGPLARTGMPSRLTAVPSVIKLESLSVPATAPSSSKRETTEAGGCAFLPLPKDLGVYPVVADVALLEILLQAGAKTIQLRIKTAAVDHHVESDIVRAIALGKAYNARVFINDHWQLAIKHGAFGVHLGQEDVSTAALDCIAAAGLALGLSSHGVFEARLALNYRPSYLALGHIFPTTTKAMPSPPQGLDMLAILSRLFGDALPTVAIGGIDKTNLAAVAACGVDNIAVVRAVTEAVEPADAFRALTLAWEACHAR